MGIEVDRIAWGRPYMEPVDHEATDVVQMVRDTYRPPTPE